MLNLSSAVPLYSQLIDHFHHLIHSGQLSPGDRFPAELELAKEYGVARITVRRAIEELVQEGLLVRRQGKGSFVAVPKIEKALVTISSFSAQIQARGMQPGSQVVSAITLPATSKLAEALDVGQGSPVLEIRRVRSVDGDPAVLETSYLSLERCPGIEKVDFSKNSLYHVLESQYGLKPASGRRTLEMVVANAQEARHLKITPGSSLFLIRAVILSERGAVAEYAKILYRADRFRFQI